MRAAHLRLGLLALPLLASLFAAPARAGGFEDAVLDELNQVRANPAAFARELRRQARLIPARYVEGEADGLAQEDPAAVEEAIAFLERQAPLPPLRDDRRLAAAASAHVAAQGPRGDVGHGPPGSLGQRLKSHAVWAGLAAETISYGQRTPRDVIRQLVVDSRVPGRGHRKEVFGGAFQAAGVACGRHAAWGQMCVIDFAGAMVQR